MRPSQVDFKLPDHQSKEFDMKRILFILSILVIPQVAYAGCGDPYSVGCSQQQTFDALQRQQQMQNEQNAVQRQMWQQQQEQLQQQLYQQQQLEIQREQLEQIKNMNGG